MIFYKNLELYAMQVDCMSIINNLILTLKSYVKDFI